MLEKIPYAGTNHWVSLAIRDALDKLVKEGDYKGVAWLDARRQRHLEHGRDLKPQTIMANAIITNASWNFQTSRDPKTDWFDFKIVGKRKRLEERDWFRVNSKETGSFSDMVENGGTLFQLEGGAIKNWGYIQKPGKEKKYLVKDVDYSFAPMLARDPKTSAIEGI